MSRSVRIITNENKDQFFSVNNSIITLTRLNTFSIISRLTFNTLIKYGLNLIHYNQETGEIELRKIKGVYIETPAYQSEGVKNRLTKKIDYNSDNYYLSETKDSNSITTDDDTLHIWSHNDLMSDLYFDLERNKIFLISNYTMNNIKRLINVRLNIAVLDLTSSRFGVLNTAERRARIAAKKAKLTRT
jgi:hypothetical protein